MRLKEFADFNKDKEGYRIPRAHRQENKGCVDCGSMKDLQPFGNEFFVDQLCQHCRKIYKYSWCSNCNMNHISGICPIDGEIHPITESTVIIERLGPHNDKEADMLITGTKPAGLISTPMDKRRLIPYIRARKLIVRREPGYENRHKMGCWIVGQANNKVGVDAIYELLKKKNEEWDELGSHIVSQRPNTEYHTKLGRLLGYSEDDINFAHNKWEKMRQAKRDSPDFTTHFNPYPIRKLRKVARLNNR